MSGGRFRNIFVYLMILAAAVFLVFNFSSQSKKVEEMPISEVAAAARAGKLLQPLQFLFIHFATGYLPHRLKDGVKVNLFNLAIIV